MLRAELKTFDSPDVLDLEKFHPDRPDDFAFLLQLTIGIVGEGDDGDRFDVVVCTPKRIIAHHQPEEIIIGSDYIIVFEYNYHALVNYLKFYIGLHTGETWEDLVVQLKKFGNWEYEQYHRVKGDGF